MGYSGGGWVVLGWWLGVSPPLLLFFFCTHVYDFFFFGVYFSLFLHLMGLGISYIFPSQNKSNVRDTTKCHYIPKLACQLTYKFTTISNLNF